MFESTPVANGAAGHLSASLDEELVQSCRQSKLVSAQKEAFISSAAQVLLALCCFTYNSNLLIFHLI